MIIISAVRGRGKNLVIDRNSIVKNENLKILTKLMLIHQKKAQNMQNADSGGKNMICY